MAVGHVSQALLGMAGHTPLLQAAIIVLATFVLEDAATVLAAMQVEAGGVPLALALGALYCGIVLGDLGLYGLGGLSRRVRWISRWVPAARKRAGRQWLGDRVFHVVFVSRFIPGARLPTYTACGFFRASLKKFALAAIVATLIWTSALFGVSLKIGAILMTYLGAWRWAGAIGFAAILLVMGRFAARFTEPRT
jgi:membrane protein DedA with SNARE-associated domain